MIRSLKATLSPLLTLTIMLVDLGQEGKEEQLLNASLPAHYYTSHLQPLYE